MVGTVHLDRSNGAKRGTVKPVLLTVPDNYHMLHSKSRKTGFTAALFAGSALLMSAWALPAQAQPGSSGSGASFKVVGASYTQELKFANCVRQHGVPDFPDPSSNGVFSLNGISPNSSQLQKAQKACQKFLPKQTPPTPAEQAKMLKEALEYSSCMRSHGVPNFPDPTTSGGGVGFSIKGMDPNSPQFQKAQQACQKLLPGDAP